MTYILRMLYVKIKSDLSVLSWYYVITYQNKSDRFRVFTCTKIQLTFLIKPI